MRVATVDVGTNTVLLLVAERRADGAIVAVTERATITRLGEGVDVNRRLSPAAIERTTACLAEYARVVREQRVDRVAVVGTSAMRDAAGGEQVAAFVKDAFGVEARVISGREEARLTFRGSLTGLARANAAEVGVFDIGGGSTEIVLGFIDGAKQTLDYAHSFDVGSVRLTERHVTTDPMTAAEQGAVSRAARSAFASVPPLPPGSTPVGVAGTMTTLAAVYLALVPYDGARVHGHTMARAELGQVVERLAKLPTDERRAVPGMEPKRADVIVAGGLIALALLDHWSAPTVLISDRGVRWGLAEDLAEERSGT
jgi:exopolyphosphatase/guanosine-5'-triphosphate,3'-diphosphate pyrophosphatase